MKLANFLLLSCFPIMLFAQLEINGYGIQQIGIESNPLRSPDLYVDADGDTLFQQDLGPTTLYSYSKVYLKARQKWEKSSLSIRPIVSYNYYPSFADANFFRAELEQQFNYKINKKWTLYEKAFGRISQRNAENQEEVFSIPNSYKRLIMSLGTQYKINKEWRLELEGNYRYNTFQTEDEAINRYSAWATAIRLKRKFRNANTLKAMEWNLEAQRRIWTQGNTEQVTPTLMYYWTAEWAATFQPADQLELVPHVQLSGRNSEIERQTWLAWQLGTSVSWADEDFKLKWTTSISNRNHPELLVDAEEELALNYLYWRNRLSAEYLFSEHLSVLLSVQHINRNSNFEDIESRFFRSYENFYCRMGVKLKF